MNTYYTKKIITPKKGEMHSYDSTRVQNIFNYFSADVQSCHMTRLTFSFTFCRTEEFPVICKQTTIYSIKVWQKCLCPARMRRQMICCVMPQVSFWEENCKNFYKSSWGHVCFLWSLRHYFILKHALKTVPSFLEAALIPSLPNRKTSMTDTNQVSIFSRLHAQTFGLGLGVFSLGFKVPLRAALP